MMNLQNQLSSLESLIESLSKIFDYSEKVQFLDQIRLIKVEGTPKEQYMIKALSFIEENTKLKPSRKLLDQLEEIEDFYKPIGGILGYHALFLKLLLEKDNEAKSSEVRYDHADGLDLTLDTPEVRQAIQWGIESLERIGCIFPVGGAGDRLGLTDSNGHPLPAADLKFCGITLLENLIQDIQALEYLYKKLFGRDIQIPIALMTSIEKDNHAHIEDICIRNNWFGRSKDHFFLFQQPLVPLITKHGKWALSKENNLLMKPGGHGVMWKLAQDNGVFEWFRQKGIHQVLVRQINNPIAGTDHSVLALIGIGVKKNKAFGFASCPRLLNASEGMDVLMEQKTTDGYTYCITNLEYTDFALKGVKDEPEIPGHAYSKFPANTNILFADINAIERALKECLLPGVLINLKTKMECHDGHHDVGRLESTMQNIADHLTDHFREPISNIDTLQTFIVYNERRKTISVTKKLLGENETPQRAFEDKQKNAYDLFNDGCEVDLAKDVIIHYTPLLGPLYSIIQQKINKGSIAKNSYLHIGIPEIQMENLNLNGTLKILGDPSAKCILKNVTVNNKGIDSQSQNELWSDSIQHLETSQIVLHGNAEILIEDSTLSENQHIEVQNGYRLTIKNNQRTLEKITQPTWAWHYHFEDDHTIKVEKHSFE